MSVVEIGECSAASSSKPQPWAKPVPVDSWYPEVELCLDEMVLCSEIMPSPTNRHEWCKITRDSNQPSAILQNKSSSAIIVGGKVVQREDTVVVNCGSEIIPGPAREDHYRPRAYNVLHMLEYMA